MLEPSFDFTEGESELVSRFDVEHCALGMHALIFMTNILEVYLWGFYLILSFLGCAYSFHLFIFGFVVPYLDFVITN